MKAAAWPLAPRVEASSGKVQLRRCFRGCSHRLAQGRSPVGLSTYKKPVGLFWFGDSRDQGTSKMRLQLYVYLLAILLATCLTGESQAQAPPTTHTTDVAGEEPAPKRIIVPDLTTWMGTVLQRHQIHRLLVIPSGDTGLHGVSEMKINLHELSSQARVVNITKPFSKMHARHGVQGAAHAHTVGASVALLIAGTRGRVTMQQLSMAMSMTRRFRRAHVITLQYNNYTDKPDSVVVLDRAGTPVEAAFLATPFFRDTFSRIYESKTWGSDGGGSGAGSSLERTVNIQRVLRDVISRYNITSMLDSSCGSMFWMPLALREVEAQNPNFRFMGTDVVCSLIDKHKINFINHTNWNFDCVDYASQPLPSGYDLVFSRDSLQHVPLHAVWQFLNNVRNSGARWLLVGSYVKSPDPNRVISPGDCYNVDVLKPPFSASKPVEAFEEQDSEKKHMLLFDVSRMTWKDSLQGIL